MRRRHLPDEFKRQPVERAETGGLERPDTAAMESLFPTPKVERVHPTAYATGAAAPRDRFACIQGVFNSRRRHSAIGSR